MSVKAN